MKAINEELEDYFLLQDTVTVKHPINMEMSTEIIVKTQKPQSLITSTQGPSNENEEEEDDDDVVFDLK